MIWINENQAVPDDKPTVSTQAGVGGMRALVLDSDDRAAHAIGLMLQASQFRVERADTVKHAAGLARQHAYDIVILDLIMPDLSGRELIRRMRAMAPLQPLLVLSRVDQPHARTVALEAGANGFLVKPFTRAELLARIRLLLPQLAVAHPVEADRLASPASVATRAAPWTGRPRRIAPAGRAPRLPGLLRTATGG